jgi:hypothetical protein
MRLLPDASSASRRESQPVNRRSLYRTVSSSVSYGFRSSFTVTPPLPAVQATGETVPVAGSHAYTVLPAAFNVTECELPCAPSLKKR